MKMSSIKSGPAAGFSLVELMIAMTLGLVMLGSIGYVYMGSRGAFRTTENLSRIQENARYALESMSRDIRMAGYVGCGNLAAVRVNTISNPPVPNLNFDNAIIGYDNGVSWVNPTGISRMAGDVISVFGAYSNGSNISGNFTPANANVQTAGNPDNLVQGDVVVITDCATADIFTVTNVPGTSGLVTLSHSNSTNTGNRIGTYRDDAFVMRMNQYTYFIGKNPANNRALYRARLGGVAEELVEHVENMQIEYGIDTSAVRDGIVDTYTRTPANWGQVVTARVSLLMRSPDDNISTATQTVPSFDGDPFTATDRRVYQVFSATIGVRNRMPSSS